MDTRTKLIISALVVIAVTVAAVLYAALAKKPPTPVPEITASPAETPTSTPLANDPSVVVEEDIEGLQARYPVLTKVPKVTAYWELEYLGGEVVDSKVPLKVTIFIIPSKGKDEQIEVQNRYIQKWLADIGQQAGTYTLNISTDEIEGY
jgi:hypothetical protein